MFLYVLRRPAVLPALQLSQALANQEQLPPPNFPLPPPQDTIFVASPPPSPPAGPALTGGSPDQVRVDRRALQRRRLAVGPLQRLVGAAGTAAAPALRRGRGAGPQLTAGGHGSRQRYRDRGGGHQSLAASSHRLVRAGDGVTGGGGRRRRGRSLPVAALWGGGGGGGQYGTGQTACSDPTHNTILTHYTHNAALSS